MSAKDRRERERGRDLARRFVALVAEIVTAPAQTRCAFNDVMDELGPWLGWEKSLGPGSPPPAHRPPGDN